MKEEDYYEFNQTKGTQMGHGRDTIQMLEKLGRKGELSGRPPQNAAQQRLSGIALARI